MENPLQPSLESKYADLEIELASKNRALQIEAALEKVRASAMAMQTSDELSALVDTVFKELTKLDFALSWCMINIIDESSMSNTVWGANPEIGKEPESYHMIFEDYRFHHEMFIAWKEKQAKWVFVLKDAEKEVYDEYLFNKTEFRKVPEEVQKLMRASKQYVASFTFSNFGGLQTVGEEPLSKDNLEILSRFGKVFDLTYTRFNDLLKAEAQTRETEIELALERVRARTMAMYKSEELSETAFLLFQQFMELGHHPDQFTIGIINEADHVIEFWHTWLGNKMENLVSLTIDEPHVVKKIYTAWKSQVKTTTIDISGKELEEYNTYRKERLSSAHTDMGTEFLEAEKRRIINIACFSKGIISISTHQPIANETILLLERFGKVFDQTYTRFLDLQKAEAQAKEAQIESSLERVRSRSMAMHKSDELKEAGELLWNELGKLGIPSLSSGYVLMDNEKKIGWTYAPNPATGKISEPIGLRHSETKEMLTVLSAWEKQEALSIIEMDEQETIAHQTFVAEHGLHLDGTIFHWITAEQLIALSPKRLFLQNFNFIQGYLMIVGGNRLTQEQIEIMLRFTKVFQQTYTRFLDLQKAEAQAREATIETALERVRSRSMGMQKSDELKEVIQLVFEQFIHLNIPIEHTGFVVDYLAGGDWHFWIADQHATPSQITVPYFDSVWGISFNEAKEKGLDFFTTHLNFEEKNKFYSDLLQHIPGLPEETKEFYFSCPGLGVSTVLFENVSLYIENFSGTSYSDEENKTLMRFGKVFQQTYTRFLDLQKAEAQAKEGQIQLAMERVRARTMAMQHSNELPEAANLLFHQMQALGMPAWSAGYCIWEEDKKAITLWMSSEGVLQPPFSAPLTEDPSFIHQLEAYQRGETFFIEEVGGSALVKHYQYMRTLPVVGKILDSIIDAGHPLPVYQIFHCVYFSKGYLLFITYESVPESHDIFKRFGKVFDQTYTRFLDLQKAEAQAREAQIEVALERVRARTMAMQRSEELASVATVLFQQVRSLGQTPWLCGFSIWETGDKEFTWYPGSPDGDILTPCKVPLTEHPVFISFDESRRRGDELLVYEKQGEFQADHYRYMQTIPGMRELLQNMLDAGSSFPSFQIDHLANFSHGNLVFITYEPCPEMHDIFKRFAKVFDQTYTRFIDLQKAEAQAIETVRTASLDRVRAEIASMRTTNDLQQITPLIWTELLIIGIPFFRCGVFIVSEQDQLIHAYLSTPEGKSLAVLHIPFGSSESIIKTVEHWRKQKVYTDHWNQEQFQEWVQSLIEQGQISGHKEIQDGDAPVESLFLQFIPFKQGMLYVGSSESLSEHQIDLVQSLADSFSVAYARYDDFKQLEDAKASIEVTLTKLKATQSQLIQSEKMASLGELTAGIAHEIQNPLNFVNNFSEVNTELLDELLGEAEKGNFQEVKDLVTDIRENEQKINHHGKRADAIVKGMLQHSRASNDQKEMTDINALADEYLRLAYHGLRAKDKSFNASLNTAFDPSIGKIQVIPQDIGRVLLNLYNNAFYAVNERNKLGEANYEPTVEVITELKDDKIQILVKDNGTGISEKLKEKIFQPFFTTKPTGQGTGLGLSLSYDIVTIGHSGELKVETKEGEETKFIISLPVYYNI